MYLRPISLHPLRFGPKLPTVACMATQGQAVKTIREAQGLGLNELARMAGVGAGYLSRFERGEVEPRSRWVRSVTDALAKNLTDRGAA